MDSNTKYHILETDAYAELSLKFPPIGYPLYLGIKDVPLCKMNFDMLLTVENKTKKFLESIPFYSYWHKFLIRPTLFSGCTITEYLPFPNELSYHDFFESMLSKQKDLTLLVIKDIPWNSPLLDKEENDFFELLVQAGKKNQFSVLEGEALAYVPIDFSSIDDWLSRFSHSRRKNLRRKFRSLKHFDIEILPLGSSLFFQPEFIDEVYDMFMEVYNQSEIHFDLLTKEFLAALLQSDIPGVCFLYKDKEQNNKLICWNICLINKGILIDKFIGFRYPDARNSSLYFGSWVINLDYAIKNNMKFYVAGWTDPEVKSTLGAKFTMTRHLVHVVNPLLFKILYPFRHFFEADTSVLDSLNAK